MGYERWLQMCETSEKASDNDALKSIATVETRTDDEEQ